MNKDKSCEYCETIFKKKYLNSAQRFCSPSCRTSFNNKHRIWKDVSKRKIGDKASQRYKGDGNPNYRGGGISFLCKVCGKQFKVPKGQLTGKKQSGKFCTLKCYHFFLSKNKQSSTKITTNKRFLRCIIYLIKNKKESSKSKWFNHIDFTIKEFKTHITTRFTEGMSWENYGEWHIDHIKPCSYFNYETEFDDDFKKCWALNNLQPLWAKDNMSKGGNNTLVNKKIYERKKKNIRRNR